jgi:hypothetical protein
VNRKWALALKPCDRGRRTMATELGRRVSDPAGNRWMEERLNITTIGRTET